MPDLLIPPWLRISATEPGFESNTEVGRSIFTRAIVSTERPGDGVYVRLSTQNASERETDPNLAFLKSHLGERRGQVNRVWYTPATAGYRCRGAFSALAFELLANNTFASGTAGWASNHSDTGLSASDRALRLKRAANTDSPTVLNSTPSAAVLYAPYVGRVFAYQGRGAIRWDVRIRDLSDATSFATTATSQTTPGLLTCTDVVRDTDATIGIVDRNSGKVAGDYMDIAYASLARCALVDNGPNLLLHSDALDNAAWTKGGATITANGTTAPDGTTTADEIVEDTSTGNHFVVQVQARTSQVSDYVAVGAFKANSRDHVYLSVRDSAAGTNGASCIFNLTAGTSGTPAIQGTAANARAFIVSLGNGWYYCAVVAQLPASSSTVGALAACVQVTTTISYTGDGSSIRAWRLGSARSSVPIRLAQTTTTAATATAQTGSALHLKGLPASTSGLLLMSDWVQSGKQLCQVVGRLDSDAAGLGYLQLAYPPRFAPADGDPIIVHEPMGRFVANGNRATWQERPGIFADFDVELTEALES